MRAVDNLPHFAQEAGFEVRGTSGYFKLMDQALGFELHASTLAAARERAVGSGVASEQDIDDLVLRLRAAKDADYEWVSFPFMVDLTLRKPLAA